MAPSLVLARITASCISWIAFKQHLCIFNVTAEMMRRQPRFPIPPSLLSADSVCVDLYNVDLPAPVSRTI